MSIPLDALRALLEEERTALLAGDFDQLGRLADRKAHLCATLDDMNPDHEQMHAIRDMVLQNATLLKAAQAGLDAARLMLAGERPVQTMTVYASDGASRALRNIRPGLQRKA